MKEQAIQKINKIGKISNVITLIAKILIGIAMVFTIIGSLICFLLPDSFVKVTTAGTMAVDVDFSALGIEIPAEELATFKQEAIADAGEEGYAEATAEFTETGMQMTGELEQYTFTIRDLAWIAVMGVVVLALTFITLFFVGGLCKAFRDCQSPFEDNVIKKMQNFAISLIPWSLVSMITSSITNTLMYNKTSIMFTIDFNILLIVLVVLVLVYIFKYGAVLQQESDETL
ncbi:MAG: DUF2975 domain-containing protein [Lachnospiraceae bacterium]|nr:DUF2975 domain-containing protein [Lachnospiraceae bacterium]